MSIFVSHQTTTHCGTLQLSKYSDSALLMLFSIKSKHQINPNFFPWFFFVEDPNTSSHILPFQFSDMSIKTIGTDVTICPLPWQHCLSRLCWHLSVSGSDSWHPPEPTDTEWHLGAGAGGGAGSGPGVTPMGDACNRSGLLSSVISLLTVNPE